MFLFCAKRYLYTSSSQFRREVYNGNVGEFVDLLQDYSFFQNGRRVDVTVQIAGDEPENDLRLLTIPLSDWRGNA